MNLPGDQREINLPVMHYQPPRLPAGAAPGNRPKPVPRLAAAFLLKFGPVFCHRMQERLSLNLNFQRTRK